MDQESSPKPNSFKKAQNCYRSFVKLCMTLFNRNPLMSGLSIAITLIFIGLVNGWDEIFDYLVFYGIFASVLALLVFLAIRLSRIVGPKIAAFIFVAVFFGGLITIVWFVLMNWGR